MKLSLIAAKSANSVIGTGPLIPWQARGEQLLFKAFTFNQWLLMGRKTFEAMGILPDRKYAVLTRNPSFTAADGVLVFASVPAALTGLAKFTDHVFVSGGGQIYRELIGQADFLHLSTIHTQVDGDVLFPDIPAEFTKIFSQQFSSNIDYTYEIWKRK